MSDNDLPHPPLHILTNDEINVIKESWKIPSAHVSKVQENYRNDLMSH